jgi:hypothetical protein
MPTSPQLPPTIRLDDLVQAITRAHTDVLDQLANAVLLADHLDEISDHLVGHFVDQARAAGLSWTRIGTSMGVTKQAARKRFRPADGPDLATDQGFHRFTPRARNTVLAAQNEAHAAGSPEIGPGHLLLGLLAEPDTHAVRALAARGATPDAVRAAVAAVLAPPTEDAPALVPYDEPARKVLELTFREALRLGHAEVGTEHILLALLEHEGGTGVLAGLGVDKPATEAYLTGAISES